MGKWQRGRICRMRCGSWLEKQLPERCLAEKAAEQRRNANADWKGKEGADNTSSSLASADQAL